MSVLDVRIPERSIILSHVLETIKTSVVETEELEAGHGTESLRFQLGQMRAEELIRSKNAGLQLPERDEFHSCLISMRSRKLPHGHGAHAETERAELGTPRSQDPA